MGRNLVSIADFAKTPGQPQSEHSIRWQIQNASRNGLNAHQALVRIGRRVFIDVDRWNAWIDSQQHQHQAKAA